LQAARPSGGEVIVLALEVGGRQSLGLGGVKRWWLYWRDAL